MLRAAVSQLSPGAAEAFLPAAAGTAARPNLTDMEAREATREVHHAIKRFRDDRRDGLVGARNLIWAMLVVALPAHLLLGPHDDRGRAGSRWHGVHVLLVRAIVGCFSGSTVRPAQHRGRGLRAVSG
jgi:hypothetical protein